jgi:hypothetical protein
MKIGSTLAIIVTPIALLSGCASISRPVPMAPDNCWVEQEQFGERTRFYSNIDESQALRAAERLLRLAGKDDMLIRQSQHSITAEYHRESRLYLFLVAHQSSVWDHWVVSTRRGSGGVHICAHVRGQYFTDTFVLGAEPITNAVYPANATEQDPGKYFKPPASAYPIDFDTFWARLEYLMGLQPSWASCPPVDSGGIWNNKIRGRMELNPLCHALVDDPSPPDVHWK